MPTRKRFKSWILEQIAAIGGAGWQLRLHKIPSRAVVGCLRLLLVAPDVATDRSERVSIRRCVDHLS